MLSLNQTENIFKNESKDIGLEESLDNDWESFMNDTDTNFANQVVTIATTDKSEVPKCSQLYISTKTKTAYLNTSIDIEDIFWKIKISPYHTPEDCIIKKQIKLTSLSKEKLEDNIEKMKNEPFIIQDIITQIDKPNGRIKFKDIRKITVGISKKDILSHRSRRKGAFYNCFVLYFRIKVEDAFKEFHIKVFNTGKLEIPGLQDDSMLDIIINKLITVLQPHSEKDIYYIANSAETILINSNFDCNYFVRRDILCNILCTKYKIHAMLDDCSYPGVQCKYYYNIATL